MNFSLEAGSCSCFIILFIFFIIVGCRLEISICSFISVSKLYNSISKLPDLENPIFKEQITNLLFQKEKYEFNKNILEKINKKTFNQASFDELGKNNIKEIKLDSIKDTKKFEANSIQILYSLPINSFTLIANKENDVFIAKTVQYEENNINKNSTNFEKISSEEGAQSKNNILKSYDLFLNSRYQVVVNEKTLERVKNYFK